MDWLTQAHIDAWNKLHEERRAETWEILRRMQSGEVIELEEPEFKMPFRVLESK